MSHLLILVKQRLELSERIIILRFLLTGTLYCIMIDKAEAAYRRACNAAAHENAFICAAAIFLGLSGNDLERELAIYDYERRFK